MTSFVTLALAAAGLITSYYAMRRLKLRYILASVCLGVAALFASNLIADFFRFHMPVNLFTLLVSAVGGIPGVILLHTLSAMLR